MNNETAGRTRGRDVFARARATIERYGLASGTTPCVLMVSGGSDSTALAYLARDLRAAGAIGPLAMLHVNHCLRGADADDDEAFVAALADELGIPLFSCRIDVAGEAARTGENVEAVGRRERYAAAREALESLCRHAATPVADGRILTAHTADDRVENFYMRSIVGTGPGGFRSMRYANGPVARPLLDVGRDELRAYLEARAASGAPCVRDAAGALWREDATNAHTDRFRAYVRHEIVPRAKARNAALLDVLGRTMNLIADEDDLLERMASGLVEHHVAWTGNAGAGEAEHAAGCIVAPAFGMHEAPLARRAIMQVLRAMLGSGARIEAASVDAVLGAWEGLGRANARPHGGYVRNIQGDLAVSANKHGVRIEPMRAFRARRKRG